MAGKQEWRHGWIPLTPAAALVKAKGSTTGAAKLRKQHGVKASSTRDLVRAARQTSIDSSSSSKPRSESALAREERMAEEQRLRTNADVVARTRPTPSSADLSDAAAIFKARNPGKGIAGNEREVQRIADDLWRAKRLKSPDTGNTDAQKAAERDRIRAAADGEKRIARQLLEQKRGAPKTRSQQLREQAAAERAKLQGIADRAGTGRLGVTDPQANRLSGAGLRQAHKNTDSSLRRYTETQQRANALEGKAIRQEGREREAGRTRLTREDVQGATHIVDQHGNPREVVRVNAKTVTVKTPYSWTETVPIEKIRRAIKATPEQLAEARRRAALRKG